MSQIRAFIVAVETYQGGNISPVEFAEADALTVSESLKYSGVKEDDLARTAKCNGDQDHN